jgi:prevent-host-death family protein
MYISLYIPPMKRYSISDARENLPSLVTEAESGSQVELTRRGKPVAVLISIHEYQRMRGNQREFKQAYAEFVRRFDLDEVGLDEAFVRSLRDRSVGREVEL